MSTNQISIFLIEKARILISIFAIIGLLDALFIAFFVENGFNTSCTIAGTPLKCGEVLGSTYATFFGFSDAILASFWFLVILIIYILDYRNIYLMIGLAILGLCAIIYFVFLELFIINYICLYCTLGHIMGLGIIVLILYPVVREYLAK